MDSPDSTLQTAFQMCQQGQFEQARPLLLQVLEHDPKELNALQLLGTVAYQGRDLEGAAAWYRRALAVEDEPTLHYNLALVLEDQHRLNEAEAEYRAALKRHPSFAPAWNNLGSVLRRKGLLQQAEQCYRRVLGFKPGVAGHHANLARVLQDQGRRDEALASYRRVLEIDPNDATARYMVAAFTGSENPAAPPSSYISSLYDHYAERYDQHLTQVLGYRVPEALRDLLAMFHEGSLETLDLGCGTGLSGLVLRDLSRRLVGVDLSQKMLDKAEGRGIYDALVKSDIVEAMRSAPAAYDLLFAADVLMYLGDLEPVFAAAQAALRPGGLFAFSVEHQEGERYKIQPTGRYVHEVRYVRQAAEQAGLSELAASSVVLRHENGVPVQGDVFVFQREGESSDEG